MFLSPLGRPRRPRPTTPHLARALRRRRRGPLAMSGLLAAMLLAVTVPAAGWEQGVSGGPANVSTYEPAWSWPLSPVPAVVRPFEAPPQRWLAGHRGVDLAAPPGVPVLSPAAGTVTFTGWVVNRPVLTVDLGDGLLASFEPVVAEKSAGEPVAEGEVLGRLADPASAAPGHCAASCLHWGVRLNREYVNPLKYVTDRRPSVLLPLR
ncbi:M23 family metallopeptidase [Arthrobacter sp. ATA002]|uniref:M23 family metallopeptidase n=1 Tax=Arthrobacter sp. ATA002 TaxID=2991715 RepID=UPI0022A6BCD0|nr:M23 family metallopeptidase [Arthrobacter sp. ATA002]WAP51062.1 M23 family metallopeptidase [Arthrobacter sp. ATA002]